MPTKRVKPNKEKHLCEDCSVVLGHSEAFMWIDRTGRISFANPATTRLLQWTTNELKTMSVFELTNNITPLMWCQFWESTRLNGQKNIECDLISKDGNITPVFINLQAGRENPALASAIIKASPRSVDEHSRLKRVSYEYDKLLYRTSHDLKAPISTVLGLVNLLRREETPSQREYLDLIEETMDRQHLLMQDISHLALIGSTEVTREKINMPMLIDDVVTSFAKERHQGIKWHFDFKVMDPFYSDRYLLTKMLTPIVDNAIRYNNNRDPFIKITVETTPVKVTIVVEDNGIGVRPELSKRIFEMFFRGVETSKGSGLGLYLALITANKLNGNVVLLPKNRCGATFKMEIPNISYAEFSGVAV